MKETEARVPVAPDPDRLRRVEQGEVERIARFAETPPM